MQGLLSELCSAAPSATAPAKEAVWTQEPPPDITAPALAFFARQAAGVQALESSESATLLCAAVHALCALLRRPRLSQSAAAAACALAAAVASQACLAPSDAYGRIVHDVVAAMSAVREGQGSSDLTRSLLRKLLWGLRQGCPGAVDAVAALTATVQALPPFSLSSQGQLQDAVGSWARERAVEEQLLHRALFASTSLILPNCICATVHGIALTAKCTFCIAAS